MPRKLSRRANKSSRVTAYEKKKKKSVENENLPLTSSPVHSPLVPSECAPPEFSPVTVTTSSLPSN